MSKLNISTLKKFVRMSLPGKVLFCLVFPSFFGAVLTFDNYILFGAPVAFWQWTVLALTLPLVGKKGIIHALLNAATNMAIVLQVAIWLGLLTAPVFKLPL